MSVATATASKFCVNLGFFFCEMRWYICTHTDCHIPWSHWQWSVVLMPELGIQFAARRLPHSLLPTGKSKKKPSYFSWISSIEVYLREFLQQVLISDVKDTRTKHRPTIVNWKKKNCSWWCQYIICHRPNTLGSKHAALSLIQIGGAPKILPLGVFLILNNSEIINTETHLAVSWNRMRRGRSSTSEAVSPQMPPLSRPTWSDGPCSGFQWYP